MLLPIFWRRFFVVRPAPQLADTLAAVPRMRPEAFNRLFDDNLQDLLMVSYLSSLTNTQLAIAEKLAS